MEPRNDLLSPGSDGYLFAKEGAVYAAYTPGGNTISIDLSAASGSYRARWFDPRSGGFTDAGTVGGGAVWAFGPPGTGDVALLLERQ